MVLRSLAREEAAADLRTLQVSYTAAAAAQSEKGFKALKSLDRQLRKVAFPEPLPDPAVVARTMKARILAAGAKKV